MYCLFALIAIVALFIYIEIRRKKCIDKFGDKSVVSKLILGSSMNIRIAKYLLFAFTYTFLIIGLANPQVGSKIETVERKGIDVVIALDISNSMLAEDIKPSRLDRAKQAIANLMDNMKNDRIAMVVFAGKAYLQMPLTTDYGAVKMLLNNISPSFIPAQGTALAEAIKISMEAFNDSDNSKVIIIITDGENHIGDAVAEAKKAAEKGISVHTIGIGMLEGTPIPIIQNGRNVGYKKDNKGMTVVTKLDEASLIKVADAGQGTYTRANSARVGLQKIIDDINNKEKTVFETQKVTDYKDQFQYFIGVAILLFLFLICIPDRVNNRFKIEKLFTKRDGK
ncbi:VWA domain-containing protein [Bacteroidales bacterium OttesenSCG-928-K03]|nr:VWA domain-containing protein [Odoribacter sp. OttesenSCG-928-L07]MDL2238654.1 VWA domain-containing protein [Bacteroidales bacterium OttesenSCG-928-L14]MDL2240289.1 VWA domain-containing protein [Bacteroidales bacterium OttesenSCG-928-K22]MDL2242997.1 VWA domain-containing protein [Bacteroidales bacterium OttesenSCG-928-K03]